jgi:mannose-6-phosphate isomerase-like protein (cupin superfamily)
MAAQGEGVKRVFSIGQGFQVPDGTTVYHLLNPKDKANDLEWDLLDGFSIVAGDIGPGASSSIHLHPIVTQVTWVVSGNLTVKMKEPGPGQPYTLELSPEQAVVTRPGTLFQLINVHDRPCRVLYIVSPSYLFELDDDGRVAYDDAIVLEQTWDDLALTGWELPPLASLEVIRDERERSLERLRAHKAPDGQQRRG